MIELLPCPFCGGDAEITRQGTRRQSCRVSCGECGCDHESGDEGDESGASWNQRAAPPRLTAPNKSGLWAYLPADGSPGVTRAFTDGGKLGWQSATKWPDGSWWPLEGE